MTQLLTHSRMATAKACLRKHYLSYELGIRRDRTAQPLRMGSAFHLGIDLKAQGKTANEAIEEVSKGYSVIPPWCTGPESLIDWQIETATVVRLLHAYFWLYADDPIEVIETEQKFFMDILNPDTGRAGRNFKLAGKLDKIIKLQDGRIALYEHKTTSDSVAPESEYWSKLAIDSQISLYVHAARRLGFNVESIVYDVARKPEISPKYLTQSNTTRFFDSREYFTEKFDVTCKDGSRWFINDVEATVDYEGKKPALRETVDMWAARLTDDITTRPHWYFARREIPRLEADLKEFEQELWQTQQMLRDCQKFSRWFKNANSCSYCEYRPICFNHVDPLGELPAGFIRTGNVHEELGDISNGNSSTTTSGTETEASTAAGIEACSAAN